MRFNRLQNGKPWKGRLQRDGCAAHRQAGAPVELKGYLGQGLLGEVHHPAVVLVGNVDFHYREFWVVGAVHALVAEVFGKFIDAVESAYN